VTLSLDDPLRRESYDRRLIRLRAAMQEAGIELLIAYGNGRHSFLAMNPAWWLTGFRQLGPHLAVIVTLDDEPRIVTTPLWDRGRAEERSAIKKVIACEPDDFLRTVESEIGPSNWLRASVAVSGGGQMPRPIHEAWREMLGHSIVDADQMVSDLARIRDAWSLKCTRAAVAIAEEGYAFLLETARPGMREHELAAELEAYCRGRGAEDNFQLLSSSQHNRNVHRPTSRIMAEGDVLLGEITPSVEGEFAQICRTVVMGEPTAQQRRAFALLDEALHAGMALAKPGVPVADIVRAMNAPIEAAGYGQYTVPPYMRTRGHSMAMGSTDPEIALQSGHVLAEDVVFVMHPNQYLPETGYFMCGEPVIIRPHGAEPLTSRMGELGSIQSADTLA